MNNIVNLLRLPVLAGFLMSIPAFGTVVGAGTFNLSGTAVGTTTGISFYFAAPGDNTGTINLPTSGVFASLAPGTHETILALSAPQVIPGNSFDFQNWITLTDGINLDATSIPIPIFPVCPSSGAQAIGFQCIVSANSPVILTQGAAGVSARINIYGEAHYAVSPGTLTPFTALFNSPTTNFATIAAFETYFKLHGAIPAVSYAASFTTPAAVPEPAAIFLTSVALLGFSLVRKRRASR